MWPVRDYGGYILVDTNLQNYLALTAETYFRPLGLQHFYAAFALDTNVSLRADVLTQFQLDSEDVTRNFQVLPAAVVRKGWSNHYEQPTDQVDLELCRDQVPEDVITLNQSEIDKELEL